MWNDFTMHKEINQHFGKKWCLSIFPKAFRCGYDCVSPLYKRLTIIPLWHTFRIVISNHSTFSISIYLIHNA